MGGRHHWCNEHELETPGDGEGQGGLVCCSPWDRKESDMTRWLNNYFCYLNGETFLPTKVHLVKAMVFPIVMYGCESWTIKKAECWKIDTFELWCWKRHLRVPWTARRSNQSILKEISPEYSLEGLMLKLQYLATWCKELTHLKRPWCWERLKAGGEGDNRGWDGWMASPTQWTWVWVSSGSWTGKPGVLQSMGSQRVRHNWTTEVNWNWEMNGCKIFIDPDNCTSKPSLTLVSSLHFPIWSCRQ